MSDTPDDDAKRPASARGDDDAAKSIARDPDAGATTDDAAASLDESTRAWWFGEWELEEVGPTSVRAPYLANELARRMLTRLPDDVAELPPTLAIEMFTRDMLTFSFELDADVLDQLARIGADLEYRLNVASPASLEMFEPSNATIGLESYTGDRDPSRVSKALGIEPTALHHAGERRGVAGAWKVGTWRLERERDEPRDPDTIDVLVRELCDGIGTDLPARCRDEKLSVRLSLVTAQLAGGFAIAAESVARLAALGTNLGIYFYNVG